MKLKIKNYQIIEDASLEFIPGLNVIIGQTHNGKSAIIRSIETAIYNLSRESHVTVGKEVSAVGIGYNGHEVIWRRDTKAASQVTYRVDGKVYGKLGKGQPEVVKEALGISEVEINEKKIKVNFSKQMTYPFLLDATPSEFFKFVVQSSEEDNIVDVLNTMRSDVNEIVTNVKKYEEARDSLGEAYAREVKKFKEKKPYLSYCEEVLKMEGKVKELKRLKEMIQSHEKCAYVIQKAEESVARIKSIQKTIEESEKALREKIETIEKLSYSIARYRSSSEEISNIEGQMAEDKNVIERLQDLEKYVKLLQDMEPNQIRKDVLQSKVDDYRRIKEDYDKTEEEVNSLREDIDKKERVWAAVDRALKRTDEEKVELEKLRESVSLYQMNVSKVDEVLSQIEREKASLVEIEDQISQIGVCPYCGSELKGDSHEHS